MDKDKLAGELANVYEGTKLFPYMDTTGNVTIGVGHNLTAKGITPNQAAQWLYEDITDTIKFLDTNLLWWKDLDEVRQRALANMTFDLMGKVLGFHNMLAALQAKQWDKAADELLDSLFAKQVGKRAIDIASMFRTGRDVL